MVRPKQVAGFEWGLARADGRERERERERVRGQKGREEGRSAARRWKGRKPSGLLVSQRVPLQRQMAYKVGER